MCIQAIIFNNCDIQDCFIDIGLAKKLHIQVCHKSDIFATLS